MSKVDTGDPYLGTPIYSSTYFLLDTRSCICNIGTCTAEIYSGTFFPKATSFLLCSYSSKDGLHRKDQVYCL